MKSFATAAAALIALIPSVIGLTINTPQGVNECEPFQFTWTGGTPPYFLSLIPAAGQAAIKQFPTQTGTTFTWLVDLQANTNFIAALKDNTGMQAFAASATINPGTDSNCLNTAVIDNGSGSGSGTATGTGTATGSGISAASSANAASATPTSAASSHSGGSSASGTASGSSPSKTSNAAFVASSASTFGIAGLFGLVGAALF